MTGVMTTGHEAGPEVKPLTATVSVDRIVAGRPAKSVSASESDIRYFRVSGWCPYPLSVSVFRDRDRGCERQRRAWGFLVNTTIEHPRRARGDAAEAAGSRSEPERIGVEERSGGSAAAPESVIRDRVRDRGCGKQRLVSGFLVNTTIEHPRRARGDAVEGEVLRGGFARIALEERSAGPVTTSTGERKPGEASPRDEPAGKEPRARSVKKLVDEGRLELHYTFASAGQALCPGGGR